MSGFLSQERKIEKLKSVTEMLDILIGALVRILASSAHDIATYVTPMPIEHVRIRTFQHASDRWKSKEQQSLSGQTNLYYQ